MNVPSLQLATWRSRQKNSTGSKAQNSCCSLSNQPPHHSRLRKGPAVLVGHRSVDVALKEGEHGEPDACSSTLLVGPGVGQSVVVQEESGGDVERYENVNGVMLMCGQDEENSKEIQDPGQGVNEVPASWSVCWWNEKKEKFNIRLKMYFDSLFLLLFWVCLHDPKIYSILR